MSAFKAYDIRGIYGSDFTREDARRIGFYLPQLLHTQKILVGRDVRVSSPEIHAALCEGITQAGATVYDLGICTTPMVYWATARCKFEASVMITASHNPPQYNGMKISGPNALPVGYDTGLQQLEQWIQTPPQPVEAPGSIIPFPKSQEYLDFLRQSGAYNLEGLRLVIDCSNGMAGLFARSLFGENHTYLFETPDGTFPHHEPNPLEEKNLVALKERVVAEQADLGVIFDGDADRVMFVDETGQFIPPDLMIALLAHFYLREGKLNEKVLIDIRTSKSVSEYLSELGAEVHIWKVGRAFAARKLREIQGLFGGELAGHYYFSDFYYSDSGLLAALRLLHVINSFRHQQGLKASEIIARIRKYYNSGEINFRIADKEAAMQRVIRHFTNRQTPTMTYDFDGYRIEFEDGWFNIRPSNTEPYLRFLAEARTREKLDEMIEQTRQLLQE
ncbi:MAG: phosphomannomutase/phosphoglucomutase [Bacteroidales bacterium]